MKDYALVKIDNREIGLQYNFNDLCDAEPQTGCNLLAALENLGGGLTGVELRGLIYAMIIPFVGLPDSKKDPKATIEACGDLIKIHTIADWIAGIGEACAIAVSQEYAERFQQRMKQELPPKPAEPPEAALAEPQVTAAATQAAA